MASTSQPASPVQPPSWGRQAPGRSLGSTSRGPLRHVCRNAEPSHSWSSPPCPGSPHTHACSPSTRGAGAGWGQKGRVPAAGWLCQRPSLPAPRSLELSCWPGRGGPSPGSWVALNCTGRNPTPSHLHLRRVHSLFALGGGFQPLVSTLQFCRLNLAFVCVAPTGDYPGVLLQFPSLALS